MHPNKTRSNRILLGSLYIYICTIIFISLRHLGPVYLSDEIGYAAKAAHLAGQSNLLSSSWHAGYSLAIAPLFMAFGISPATWTAIAIFNLALLFLSILFWFSTLRKLGFNSKKASWISLSSLACFAVWGFTGWIFVNPILQLLIALLSRCILIERKSIQIPVIALTGGIAYWIHPTGALIAACAWLATLTKVFSYRSDKYATRRILANLVSITAGAVLTLGLIATYKYFHSSLNISMGGNGGHYSEQISGYIQSLAHETSKTLLEIFTGLLNGIANLSIATFGYSTLLVTSLMGTPQQKREEDLNKKNMEAIAIFAACTTVLLLLFSSALSINMENNYQCMLHQRYISPIIQSLWILGVARCMPLETSANLRTRIIIAVSPVLVAIVVGATFWNYDKTFSIIDLMSSGSSVIAHRLGSHQEALLGLGIGAILIISVQILAPYPKLIFAGIIAALVGFESSSLRGATLREGSSPPALREKIKNIHANEQICLAAIKTPLAAYESENTYEFYFSSSNIRRVINRFKDRKDYNPFFRSDPSPCNYIIAPLDIRLVSQRPDAGPVIHKLSKCSLRYVDHTLGWGLYECASSETRNKTSTYQHFITARDGADSGPIPANIRPLLVYTQKDIRHEKKFMGYAKINSSGTEHSFTPCADLQSNQQRLGCKQKKEAFISKRSNTPILWGIYTDRLSPGPYKLYISNFRVLKGSATVEIVDKDMNRLANRTFFLQDRMALLDFTIPSDIRRIEVRIEATRSSVFSNPTHIVISH